MSFLKKLKINAKNKNKDEVIDKITKTKEDLIFNKYRKGLKKSSESFSKKIKKLTIRKIKIDESYFEELEEIFILSDFGAIYTNELIKKLKDEVRIRKISNPKDLNDYIFKFLYERYNSNKKSKLNNKLTLNNEKLNVILIFGVNGVGKTTSIGKLLKKFSDQNLKVSVAAADTFRAGAVKQLEEWAKRTNSNIITPEKEGQDSGSVVYKALDYSLQNKDDILIIDTSGRIQNKKNLMLELQKIEKIIKSKIGENNQYESLLVIDSTTGQNGVNQALIFSEVVDLSGIILTKMDSSAKGGIIMSIKDLFDIPVKFIGLGEKIDDFEEFDIEKYLYSLSIELD